MSGRSEPDRTGSSGRQPGHLNAMGSDPPLSRVDWIAAAMVAVVLLIAPIWAASFATPIMSVIFSPNALTEEGAAALFLEIWTGPLALALTAAAFCLVAWRDWRHPVAIRMAPGLMGALAFLGVWAIFSAAPNRVVYLSLNALSFLFAALLLGATVCRLGRDRQCLSVMVLTIAEAGSIIAGIGVREYLGELRDGVVDHRTFSTFGPDFLAGYLLITLPLTLAAFAAASGRSLRVLVGVGLALQSACLFLTGSRAGTAIAPIAVVIWSAIALLTGADRTHRRWLATGIAIFAIGSGLGAMPTLSRFGTGASPPTRAIKAAARPADDNQAHSGEFRKRTWIGTVRMATRNPLIGTGIGTFAIAYPRYSDTAFTAHAHNSFLQWTAETGVPGALALLTAFAAASAFIVHVLLLLRARRNESETVNRQSESPAHLRAPGLMLAGFAASLVASLMHNCFDSDLYIVATLLTFSAVFGLAVAQARTLAPPLTQTPRHAGRELWTVGILVCLFVAVRAGQSGCSRWERVQAAQSQTVVEAIEAARSAVTADPFDPEPHLVLSQLLHDGPEGEKELLVAARIAPTGMTYYLLGREYREKGHWKKAIEAFERARGYEPHNLQALRALAETERSAGLRDQARYTYETMAALETAAYGSIRAMPELIETDFAYAHSGLADLAIESHEPELAAQECAKARSLLSRYWMTRTWLVNQERPIEKRRALADLYVHVLQTYMTALEQLGKKDGMPPVEDELHRVEADILADDAKMRESGG